jgi:hypothetical protein
VAEILLVLSGVPAGGGPVDGALEFELGTGIVDVDGGPSCGPGFELGGIDV